MHLPYRLLLTTLVATILIAGTLWVDRWDNDLYHGDSCFYYMHVVSALVYGDVGEYDRTIGSLREQNPDSADPREDKFGVRRTERGRRYIKYTLGVPVLEVPFFLIAHAYANLSPTYAATGWTRPYLLAIGLAIPIYVALGCWLLIGLLRRYFSRAEVALTVLALVLATNLFYQATFVTMSHGFLFFLHCWLLHATVRFWEGPGRGRALLLGAVVGLIALTRVPEVVAALVPVVWGVSDRRTLAERWKFVRRNVVLLLPATVGFLAVFSLQLAYWYYVSGQLIFNPYDGEGFNFLKVRLYAAFFAYNNGWLLYTPLMVLALLGLVLLRRYARGWLLPILCFVVLQCWIHYSYYVVSYFPGMGQRPMVETYPYLSFGLAATFAWAWRSRLAAWFPPLAVVLFGALNLFQTWQSRRGIIWTENHNEAFYWQTFGATENSLNQLRAFHSRVYQPDTTQLVLVDTLEVEDFETFTAADGADTTRALSGGTSFHRIQDNLFFGADRPLPAGVQPGDYLRIGIHGYLSPTTPRAARWSQAALSITLMDESGEFRAHAQPPITPFIGNPNENIFHLGRSGVWGEAAYFIRVPDDFNSEWQMTTRVINTPKMDVWLDDYSLTLWRPRE